MLGGYVSFTDKEEYQLVGAVLSQPLLYALWAAAVVHVVFFGGDVRFLAVALLLTPALLIDAKHMILPDILTVTTMLLGFVIAPMPLEAKLWGAGIGIGLFAALEFCMTRALGRPALGWGDVKLLGAFGAWGGVMCLPLLLLLGSFSALFYVVWRRIKGEEGGKPFPFGPFLIVGGWLALMHGDMFWRYLHG